MLCTRGTITVFTRSARMAVTTPPISMGSSGAGVCATTVPGSSPAAAGWRTKRMVTPPPSLDSASASRRVMPVMSGTLMRLREQVDCSVGALSAASTSSRA